MGVLPHKLLISKKLNLDKDKNNNNRLNFKY